MSRETRWVGVSIDVDSVSAHLRGYGIEDPPDDDAAYRIAIPRALELFESTGVRATFFLIAREASRHGEIVREILAAGHEVACHSMTHTQPLDLSSRESVEREIEDSKALLESLLGTPVLGFRAPGWGAGRELLHELSAAGYLYDASSYPSWMLYFLRLSVLRRGEGSKGRMPAQIHKGLFGRANPHVTAQERGELVEIPVSTIPVLRIPVYHTFRFLLPPAAFKALAVAVRLRAGSLTYAFHAVDFLDLRADGIDRRLVRHPGMHWPLREKLEAARNSLTEIGQGGEFVPLKRIAQALLRGPVG